MNYSACRLNVMYKVYISMMAYHKIAIRITVLSQSCKPVGVAYYFEQIANVSMCHLRDGRNKYT